MRLFLVLFMYEILLRHPDFWVVHKPAGVSFHSESGLGFIELLRQQYPDGNFWPVHRLDKMTSGLVIVATSAEAAALFGQLFSAGQIEKRYLALSKRKGKKKQGTIQGGMQPGRNGNWLLDQSSQNLACTQFFSCAFDGVRLFYLRPITGKTHQLRVALKSNSSPILGDSRYGGEAAERGYLHAYSVSFDWQGDSINVISRVPDGRFDSALFDHVATHFNEAELTWPQTKLSKVE